MTEVATGAERLREAGKEALGAGEWETARASFKAALEREVTAEALYGLGTALYWLTETEAAVHTLERACAEFRRDGDLTRAAFIAIELSLYYAASLGNLAVARGWLARAARLVSDHNLTGLQGWVVLCRAGMANYDSDPHTAEQLARSALQLARDSGNTDLELCALAELGASLIELGHITKGLALLDESMAGALGGEADDIGTVVYASCRTIACCTRAAEIKRTVQWIRAADDFNRRYGSAHIHASCRTHYGAILLGLGRWEDAELEFGAALRMSRTAEPALQADALTKLAELRLAQGRPEEAARLLAGLEGHRGAAFACATLHLARGELGAASSLLARRLREVAEDCLEGAALLELLIEAKIGLGTAGGALADARRLADLGGGLDCELFTARGQRALGRALAAVGSRDEAIPHIERALLIFAHLELLLEAARSHMLLATVLGKPEREAAITAARAAFGSFEELGAAGDADRAAALLRSLGVKAARTPGPRGLGVLTRREREVLGLLAAGLSDRQMAERLFLSPKTVEHHVRSILAKLSLSNRAQAAAYATRVLAQ
jgi:DNA-binding CsgD family transcriptional regulator